MLPDHQYRTGSYTGPDFSEGFHTFAVEWTPTRIEWYVNDVLRFANNTGVPTGIPFYIILNTAVGGIWPGNPDETTVFPQFHEIDYVRVFTKSDPGPGIRTLTDYTATGATVDGEFGSGEYAAVINGLNTGWGDRIGTSSRIGVDSDTQGWMYVGIDGVVPWPAAPTPDGVVVYIDSTPGGMTSNITINDRSDLGRALTSGNSRVGNAKSDLFFADGFAADYAIFVQDTFAGIFRLGHGSLQFVTGISLNAEFDVFGGHSMRYVRNATDATKRELCVRLSDLQASNREVLFVATMLNGDTAQRSNEYVGVAIGNWWDSVPTTLNDMQLKQQDFIRFRTQPRCLGDWNNSGSVDSQDFFAFLADFFANRADVDNSTTTTSQDFFFYVSSFFDGC